MAANVPDRHLARRDPEHGLAGAGGFARDVIRAHGGPEGKLVK